MTARASRRIVFSAFFTLAALWLLALGYAVLKAIDIAIVTAWSVAG